MTEETKAVKSDDRCEVFDFTRPFDYKGETIRSLTVYRPTMKIIGHFEARSPKIGTINALMEAVADASQKPLAMIQCIDPADFQPIADWTGTLLGKYGS